MASVYKSTATVLVAIVGWFSLVRLIWGKCGKWNHIHKYNTFLWFVTWLTIAVLVILSIKKKLFFFFNPSVSVCCLACLRSGRHRDLSFVSSAEPCCLSPGGVTTGHLSSGSYCCPSVCQSCWPHAELWGLLLLLHFALLQTRNISALHITVSIIPALCLLWNMCLIFLFDYCWRGTKASSTHCLIEF